MDLLTGITSILGGGITGLIGSVTQRVFEYKTKKLEIEMQKEKFANEQALRKLDAEIMAQEWTARTKVADIEAKAVVEVEDSKAFATAIKAEDKNYLDYLDKLNPAQDWVFVILEFIRGAIRPLLTVYLCFITTLIYFKSAKLLNADVILPGMAHDLLTQIVSTILYVTTTCILFWFGTRNSESKK